jgi:DMATS type aromatic prenyltransferase
MSSIFAQDGLPHATPRHVGIAKLVGLCRALGYSRARTERAVDIFDLLSPHLAGTHSQGASTWHSDITDDGTPFEFSVAFHEGATDLRMLVEAQESPSSLFSNWSAGHEVNASLKRTFGASDDSFRKVEDLFAPNSDSSGLFALWHALVLDEHGDALFKTYLNPCIHGASGAPKIAEEALHRLGRADIWKFLAPRLEDPATVLRYFSLDLDSSSNARVKVYLGRKDSADRVAHLAKGASNVRPGDVESWVTTLSDRSSDFDLRPILTCFAFTGRDEPPAATVHVPVRCYLANDEQATERVQRFLSNGDAAVLNRIVSALSPCALRENRGLITYASLRREKRGDVRVTIYLAPQLSSFGATSQRFRRGNDLLRLIGT